MQGAHNKKPFGKVFVAASIFLFINVIFAACQKPKPKEDLAQTATTLAKTRTPAPQQTTSQSFPISRKFNPGKPIRPIPPSGTHLDAITVDELKEVIRKKIQKPEDLWNSFSTNVFNNEHLKSLRFDENTVIGDIGCGPGAYEVYLILSKIPFKKLYAVDVDKKSLDIFQFILDEYFPEYKNKIELVLSKHDNVMLSEKSLDVVVMNDAHFFLESDIGEFTAEAERCLASIHRAMKSNAKAYVYEAKRFDLSSDKMHKISQITNPFMRNGFTLQWSSTVGDLFSFIFRP
jgi:SAM-dependent methyltransferase